MLITKTTVSGTQQEPNLCNGRQNLKYSLLSKVQSYVTIDAAYRARSMNSLWFKRGHEISILLVDLRALTGHAKSGNRHILDKIDVIIISTELSGYLASY